LEFQKAVRQQVKARVAIAGPAGAGKTYTALVAAGVLRGNGKVALIDTERESAKLYADIFDFDVLELDTFGPGLYVQAIQAAEKTGYSVVVIDSLSHAWDGVGGALEQKGRMEDQRGMNSWTAWRKITPIHEQLVDALLRCNMHVIVTLRSKMQYEQVTDNGKSKVQKIGMAPIQRAGMEYEFTLFCDMDVNHSLSVSKSRAKIMSDKVVQLPGPEFWQPFADWLDSGAEYEPTASEEHVLTDDKPEYTPQQEPRQETVTPTAVAQNGHLEKQDDDRPWKPDELRANLLKRTGNLRESRGQWQVPPEPGYVGAMNGKLNGILGDDDRRHTFLRKVFGMDSSKKMDKAQVQAVIGWLEGQAGPAIIADEANRLVNAVVTADAVGELFGEEEPNDVG